MDSSARSGAVVLLSGRVGAGKTTLAKALVATYGFKRLFTRDAILRRSPETPRTRLDLQAAGDQLDIKTGGRWVADEVRDLLAEDDAAVGVVVDAVLIQEQVNAVREARMLPVLHVHLTAPLEVLEGRYARKRGGIKEVKQYADLVRNATEAKVDQLGRVADIVIDTSTTPLDQEIDLLVKLLDQRP